MVQLDRPGYSPSVITFEYDDIPNPQYGLFFDGIDRAGLSKNNEVNPANRLTYDSNGLLISNQTNYREDTFY